MSLPSPDRIVALSCINVGAGPGGSTPMLARVSLVNFRGETLCDTYVAPTMPVTDYRTATTGIDPKTLTSSSTPKFQLVQADVAQLIKGKIVVGHSLWNDLSVLGIPHPAVCTRDVALYQPFRNALRSPNQVIGLQTLMWHLMCRRCQDGQLDSLENARATLDLYRSVAEDWENAVANNNWPSSLPPSTFSRCYT
ncbi:hypothetical protein CONPUDRAFT_46102 [Coniophora puteana RWD-64-598 SS2]|uniref:RNA exonuclease 4 n=1 Tax=Coniophora puteana (strain RWD-64-598) TaxID=741705 RepID=A0A5M3N5V0_CONPW|nr:uncharacterized protein CONPUDRAFT_46102 [Coniophora puteana RWD-64-598 SS2]EIW86792.1 hypothetical protein CONPUDRAFT_46102 [Coniophora puteana RWD-64-598 SS2]